MRTNKKLAFTALVLLTMGCQSHTKITPARSEAKNATVTIKAERELVPPAPPTPGSRSIRFFVEGK